MKKLETKGIILPEEESQPTWWAKMRWSMKMGDAPQPFQAIQDFCEWVYELIFPRFGDNWAWKLRYWLNPRQKWIKKHIEYYSFCDKPELLKDFVFGCVINLVEGEKYFQTVSGGEEFDRELMDCYTYITVRRKNLEDEIEKLYDELPPWNRDEDFIDQLNNKERQELSKPIYEEINTAEERLDEEDKRMMIWIISNSGGLWT
jgi:hypothetical protein